MYDRIWDWGIVQVCVKLIDKKKSAEAPFFVLLVLVMRMILTEM